jgi:hypothetical protein
MLPFPPPPNKTTSLFLITSISVHHFSDAFIKITEHRISDVFNVIGLLYLFNNINRSIDRLFGGGREDKKD